jgi:hypothetical protein
MRRAATIAAIALLVTTIGVPTGAAEDDHRVVTPDMTRSEIQEILDEGGTVYFAEGTYTQLGLGLYSQRFQLGRYGNDVTIIGAGADETVIVGGHNVFSAGIVGGNIYDIPLTDVFGDPLPRVRVTIEGIHFVDFYTGAIFVAASEGLRVSDCKFTRPQIAYSDFGPHPIGIGITVGRPPAADVVDDVRQNVFGLQPLNLSAEEVTGIVEIVNNEFNGQGMSFEPLRDDAGELVLGGDGSPLRPEGVPKDAVFFDGLWYAGMSNAIVHSGYTTADYLIADNDVSGTLSTGISTIDNGGTWTVVGNTVDASAYPSWYSSGIGLVGVNNPVVEDNEITATGDGIWAYFVDGGVFERNEVTMRPSDFPMAAMQMGFVSNSAVTKNELSGESAYGVALWLSEDNTFTKNKLRDLAGTAFFVDSNSNTFTKNQLTDIAGDGFLLMGDYNLLEKNHFNKIGGQDVIDMGVGNEVR